MHSQTPHATAWAAIQNRRPANFVFAVTTTGIYCRPGCPARTPKPAHVRLFPTASAAEAAGFRPCKRCYPRDEPEHTALIARLCAVLDAADAPPLAVLAARAGLSEARLTRLFRARTGLSPRQYAAAARAERVRAALAAGEAVTGAVYEAGYSAASRFYAEADAILGMKPAAARDGGVREQIAYDTAETRFGHVLAATAGRGVCAIELGDSAAALVAALARRFPRAGLRHQAGLGGLMPLVLRLAEADAPDLPLDLRGTLFQRRVWQALRHIPRGKTVSYTALAQALDSGPRAVAAACAANGLALAVPCHRVVRRDGALAGYRWGLARKKALLAAEHNSEDA